jgi:hypothetical protein
MRTSLGYMYKFNSHHTWSNSTHDRGGNLCVDERRAGEVPGEGERDEAHMVKRSFQNGLFSVRSAYRPALHLSLEDSGISSTSSWANGSRKVWGTYGQALPGKVQIFSWRFA